MAIEKGKGAVLINDSSDRWSVSTGQKVGTYDEITLDGKRLTIVFAPRTARTPEIAGTLAPIADAPPAADQAK